MARVLECLPRGSRVAILRLRSLGDCVLTTPALDLLKRHRPDLRVAMVVENRFRDIFEGNPDLEEILPPGLSPLRRFRPNLCLNFHGGTRSTWMTAMSGARYRAGFGHYRHPFAYNVRIPRAQEILGVDRKVHTAEHLASAMFYLGVPATEIPRAKLVAHALLRAASRLISTPGPTAIIHPVAATPTKTWPALNFLTIANYLSTHHIEPIFIGGPTDDLSPFHPHRTISGAPLADIKSLLATASLFIGNDSGPAHMAAAFGLPVVVLFGTSDPAIWGPWRTTSQIIAAPAGIAAVPVAQVIEALERVRVHA